MRRASLPSAQVADHRGGRHGPHGRRRARRPPAPAAQPRRRSAPAGGVTLRAEAFNYRMSDLNAALGLTQVPGFAAVAPARRAGGAAHRAARGRRRDHAAGRPPRASTSVPGLRRDLCPDLDRRRADLRAARAGRGVDPRHLRDARRAAFQEAVRHQPGDRPAGLRSRSAPSPSRCTRDRDDDVEIVADAGRCARTQRWQRAMYQRTVGRNRRPPICGSTDGALRARSIPASRRRTSPRRSGPCITGWSGRPIAAEDALDHGGSRHLGAVAEVDGAATDSSVLPPIASEPRTVSDTYVMSRVCSPSPSMTIGSTGLRAADHDRESARRRLGRSDARRRC